MPSDNNKRITSKEVYKSYKKDLEVTESVRNAVKTLAKQHGSTNSQVVEDLIHFYHLRSFDLLIERIRKMYKRGLSAKEINQLSVLYTLLQHIDYKIGLVRRY